MELAATAALIDGAIPALLEDETITCPHCWETIDITLDLSVAEQSYVEDCSVCCRPIVIHYRADESGLTELDVAAENG